MALMKRPRLKAIEVLPNLCLHLTFLNDNVYTVDFKPFFSESKGLAPLRDPGAFGGAVMDEWGWTVEWPAHDIQIGADTLWLDAQAQNALDENTRIFAQWRARHGLSLKGAGEALGMTPRTISAYGTGDRPVPRYIALACLGWEVAQAGNVHA